MPVYEIDSTQTIIFSIHGNFAKGAILNSDLTLSDCYIAKSGDYFAHGKTLKKAVSDAKAKAFKNTPIEDRIAEFIAVCGIGKHSAEKLSVWHNVLTGSCEFGRESFMRNNDIKPTDQFTIAEFVAKTRNQYGSDVIQMIEKALN